MYASSSHSEPIRCTIQAMEEARHYSPEIPRQRVAADNTSEAALWGRLFDPASTDLSPEAAQYLLGLRFPQRDINRMHALAEKARSGTLTLEEHIELDNYERVGHVLSIMKSKARKALKQARAVN